MPLYAIRPQERMVYEIDDARMYYRRLSLVERQEIDTRNTNDKGVRDVHRTLQDILVACIVGWEGYLDPVTAEPIPFQPQQEAAHRAALEALPAEVQWDVARLAQSTLAQREAALGNLPSGSNAGTPSGISSQIPSNGYRSPVTIVE